MRPLFGQGYYLVCSIYAGSACLVRTAKVMTVPKTLAVVLNPASGLQKAESRRYHVIGKVQNDFMDRY
ncbi:MAG: hypothetical protein LBD53_10010 [Tannerella sp.]|nr:hypothetical protein [Tannerella sp.]